MFKQIGTSTYSYASQNIREQEGLLFLTLFFSVVCVYTAEEHLGAAEIPFDIGTMVNDYYFFYFRVLLQ